jgi:hypothetical protein
MVVTVGVQIFRLGIERALRGVGVGSEGVWGSIDGNADEDISDNGDGALELVSLTNKEAIVVVLVSY